VRDSVVGNVRLEMFEKVWVISDHPLYVAFIRNATVLISSMWRCDCGQFIFYRFPDILLEGTRDDVIENSDVDT